MSNIHERRTDIAAGLARVRDRIAAACVAAGRSDSVDLLVVTKTFPATDVGLLSELGVRDVGENRDQEAKAKRAEVNSCDLRWHMIGRLQGNKAASVASWADVVETVDREALVPRLARGVERRMGERRGALTTLIQVSLDLTVEQGRGGADPQDVPRIAEAIAEQPQTLRLGGVMAVAPHPDTGIDPLSAFDRLALVHESLKRDYPHASTMSAGMSGDLEAAVRAGATQVRIGGAILGQRPSVQ